MRVLDLTTGLAGPVAGMLLGDLGAEVIRIYRACREPPRAEPGRQVWDRNKRSAACDPSLAEHRDALGRLVGSADIVLAGTAGDGVGYEDLGALGLSPGPASVWIVMPPYLLGQTPWAGRAESAGLVDAWLGHAWSQASYADVPVDSLFPLGSYMQGIWAATAAVAVTLGRRRGRQPGRIVVAGGAHGGVLISPGSFAIRRDDPHVHRPGGPGGALPNYRCYRCGDGTWLFFGAFTDAFIQRGLTALGAGHVLADSRVGGDPAQVRLPENVGWISAELDRLIAQRSRAEWVDALEAADVPVATVLGTDGWLAHDQVQAMGLRVQVRTDADEPVVMPGVFVGLSETPASVRHAAPTRPAKLADLAFRAPGRPGRPAGPPPRAELPLSGMRVLDLGTIIAGPYLATLLGELGADVLKVERPPRGDEYRVAHAGRVGVGFPVYNRDQRGLMIDLSRGGDVFMRLARTSDVVVDNYRPGVVQRLGLDHEALAAVNPAITSVSVSAFGESGPSGGRPGFDPVVQALSGIMRSQGGPDEADSPVFLTVPVNDVIAAGLGALGVCAALYAREETGRGQQVSVTLCAAACLVQSEHLVQFAGLPPRPCGGRDFAGPDPLSRLYRAGDGWVRIAGRWPDDLPALIRAGLTAPGDGTPPGEWSADHAVGIIAAGVRRLAVADVLRRASRAGIPAVRARQAHELADDRQLIQHGLLTVIRQDEAGVGEVGPGRWLDVPGRRLAPPGAAPLPGEHNQAVLLGAGLSHADLEQLAAQGIVVGSRPGR